MNEAVRLILSLSLSGSILAVFVFAVKPFVKSRVSKTLQYYLWVLVLLRLVLPVSFEQSLMNRLFYPDNPMEGSQTAISSVQNNAYASAALLQDKSDSNGNTAADSSGLTVGQRVKAGVYNRDTDHTAYFNDLFMQIILAVWLFGFLTAMGFRMYGYRRFARTLEPSNAPVAAEDIDLLESMWQQNRITRGKPIPEFYRNRYVSTPMLAGWRKPVIVIPDIPFTQGQLKSVLLHELTHYRRRDIAVKWLAVMITSLHWFNPLMILIRKEINRACELACDESVIRNLDSAGRQAYGETLLKVVSEHQYPAGVLSTTMCEEKKTLKERLTAIMKYGNGTGSTIAISAVMLVIFVCVAVALGAGVGKGNGLKLLLGESGDPTSQSIAGTSESNTDHGGSSVNISLNTGSSAGVATGMLLTSSDYNLMELVKHKVAYVGNNSKDLALVKGLPLPDIFFMQQYISLQTKEEPYSLTAYYEAAKDAEYPGEWPVSAPGSELEVNSKLNALVLFSLIGNVEDITFAFRSTRSSGELEKDAYNVTLRFSRKSIESEYGDLTALAGDTAKLADIIDEAAEKWSMNVPGPETQTQTIAKIDKLLSTIMSSPMQSSSPGDYIKAHGKEYEEILKMGKDAQPYLQSILNSGDQGLRSRIVERLCSDIEKMLKKSESLK